MTPNTLLITRTLDANDTQRLREKLAELWPGECFTIVHGQVLTTADLHRALSAQPGPSEYKNTLTTTPVPRWE